MGRCLQFSWKVLCVWTLPPKNDKYRLRSSLPSDEAALPPSKRRHRAQEAMSACVAEAATALVVPMATGVTWQDDAYKISADEESYTKCFDNNKKSVKGNEECVKVDTLIQKQATKIGGSKNPAVYSDSYQSFTDNIQVEEQPDNLFWNLDGRDRTHYMNPGKFEH